MTDYDQVFPVPAIEAVVLLAIGVIGMIALPLAQQYILLAPATPTATAANK
jgi:hypothetical protein